MYPRCPTFLTTHYRGSYIHFKMLGNDTEVKAQIVRDDGSFILKYCRSERSAKCRITRALKQ